MSVSKTIVISCAGMGTRLGIGTTKALIDIEGKPLILRQLELLKDFDDIRIVVGYQMEKVIEVKNLTKEYKNKKELGRALEELEKGLIKYN